MRESATGDLRQEAQDRDVFRRVDFSVAEAVLDGDMQGVELVLERPISLAVGNDGIIGRRVSAFTRRSSSISPSDDVSDGFLAVGIVGINFAPPPALPIVSAL